MKSKHPFQVNELGFKIEHINPKKLKCSKNTEGLLKMLDCF